MSIRLIAADLYRLMKEAEQLQKKMECLPHEKQAPLKDQLRRLNAEVRRMRGILDGQKDRPLPPKIYR